MTYVSWQLGHKDPSITLRVVLTLVAESVAHKLVDLLDGTSPRVTDTSDAEAQRILSDLESVVSRVGIEPTTRRLRVCCSAN